MRGREKAMKLCTMCGSILNVKIKNGRPVCSVCESPVMDEDELIHIGDGTFMSAWDEYCRRATIKIENLEREKRHLEMQISQINEDIQTLARRRDNVFFMSMTLVCPKCGTRYEVRWGQFKPIVCQCGKCLMTEEELKAGHTRYFGIVWD